MLLRKLGCLLTQAYVNWFFLNWIRHFFDFNNLIALLRPCCFNENWGFSFCKTWIVTTHYSQSCDLLIFLVDMYWHWCENDCLHLPVFFFDKHSVYIVWNRNHSDSVECFFNKVETTWQVTSPSVHCSDFCRKQNKKYFSAGWHATRNWDWNYSTEWWDFARDW